MSYFLLLPANLYHYRNRILHLLLHLNLLPNLLRSYIDLRILVYLVSSLHLYSWFPLRYQMLHSMIRYCSSYRNLRFRLLFLRLSYNFPQMFLYLLYLLHLFLFSHRFRYHMLLAISCLLHHNLIPMLPLRLLLFDSLNLVLSCNHL